MELMVWDPSTSIINLV